MRSQSVDPIAPAETEIAPHRFDLPLEKYVAEYVGVEPLWCDRQWRAIERAKDFHYVNRQAQIFHSLYGDIEPASIQYWQFNVCLHENPGASREQIEAKAKTLDSIENLEFVIEDTVSFDAVLDGWDIANYESNRTWASPTPEASCFAKIERKDSIRAIANKLRASIASTEKIWAIGELATAVSNTKIGGIFKVGIEPNDRPVNLKPRPCWANVFPRGEATIEWITPFQGRVLSRKGDRYDFFVGEFGIDIIVSGSFCANEFKNPNYHHAVIRQAVEAGKNFNPASANPSDPSFQSQWCKTANGDITNAGTVCQSCDGWWWAWNDQPTEGKKFLTRSLACKYLEAKYGDRAKSIECLLCV